MVRSFKNVFELTQKYDVNMRIGAYTLAIQRVAAVHRLRGMYA
jgi:glutamate dehydrogenase (NAD(P)+)